jgi:hypothetical protein
MLVATGAHPQEEWLHRRDCCHLIWHYIKVDAQRRVIVAEDTATAIGCNARVGDVDVGNERRDGRAG